MKKRNHIIFGFILNIIFVYFTIYMGFSLMEFNFLSVLLLSFIIGFYSLLPDIDHKSSTITWWFFGLGILGLIFGIVEMLLKMNNPNPLVVLILSTLFLVFTFVAGNFLKHRGIIHSIPVGILAVLPLGFLLGNIWYSVLAYISWHSHLIGDGYFFKMK